jgi:N-acetylmuramoyl-L-alanine amidase
MKSSISFLVLLIVFSAISFKSTAQKDTTKVIKIKTVVIDAGHGGHDPGCLGASAQEKEVCLNVALKLGKLISNYFPEVKVIYTRDTDVFVKLYERAEIANKNKADLFISIHANSAESPSASGTESFVMGLKYANTNLEIAKRENAVILLEDDYQAKYDGYDPNNPIMEILAGLYQQEFLGQSMNFASKVEHQFTTRNNRSSRGVKQKVLLVIYRAAMPSTLIEIGFLTNKAEHDMLKVEKGQKETAAAIFRAFLEYKREMEGATPFEIAAEEAKVFENWEKIFAGDTEVINQIKPKDIHYHNNPDNPKINTPIEQELVIKVQITSSSKKIPLNSRKFSGLNNVKEYEEGGTFKYVVGAFDSLELATEEQKKIQELGFKDAFLVAFYKGERVSIKKAREIIADKNSKK